MRAADKLIESEEMPEDLAHHRWHPCRVGRSVCVPGSRVAAVGEWISLNTFFVEIEIVGYSTFDTLGVHLRRG